LIGEIFYEEEREMSSIYEGILRAIASGRVISGEIASYLFSRRLIKKEDASIIQPYLNNLVSFGLIRRVEVFNKRKFVYKIASPLVRIYYYADEKYNISERKVGREEILRIIDELMPRIVEDEVREFLAEKHGLRESVIEAKDFEVDGCLLRFNKPEIALEVKWGRVSGRDIKRVEEKLSKVPSARRVLFVQDKNDVEVKPSAIEVVDVDDL
ncbi:MAG: hypothetical protein QXR12_06855, partial [Thermofilum sp.]